MKGSAKCRRDGQSRSHTVSVVSLAFIVLALTCVVCWHEAQTVWRQAQQPERSFLVRRFLQGESGYGEDNKDAPTFDDDQKRSETCKKYLYNFLNGTTDGRDQCQAFYNAYKTADCENDSHVNILGQSLADDKNKTDELTERRVKSIIPIAVHCKA